MRFRLEAGALARRRQALEQAQQVVNRAVLELSEPYLPRDTGALMRSGGVLGKAAVGWARPYAAARYRAPAGKGAAVRGGWWFERMKAARLGEIVDRAARRGGGRSG